MLLGCFVHCLCTEFVAQDDICVVVAHRQRWLRRFDQLRTLALVSVLHRLKHAILFTLGVAGGVDAGDKLVMSATLHVSVRAAQSPGWLALAILASELNDATNSSIFLATPEVEAHRACSLLQGDIRSVCELLSDSGRLIFPVVTGLCSVRPFKVLIVLEEGGAWVFLLLPPPLVLRHLQLERLLRIQRLLEAVCQGRGSIDLVD